MTRSLHYRSAIAGAALLAAALSGSARGVTITIHADGSGDYPTIQEGINASVTGDVVELADGIYQGSGNRDLRFSGRRIILRSISGDPTRCVIDAEHENHVVTFYSETPELVVENIGLVNGWSSADGGVVYMVNLASPTIRGCIIAGGRAARGGGVFADGRGTPVIEDCWILDNQAGDGGGVFAIDETRMRIDGCVIAGNRATGQGGAGVWFGAASAPIVHATTVALNEVQGAGVGGGLFVHAQTTVEMDRTIFWGNTTASGASDVHVWDLSCDVLVGCSLLPPEGIRGFDGITEVGPVITDDPEFCLTPTTLATFQSDAFALAESSPCLPENNGCATLIGARPICGDISPTERLSWGAIKSRF